MARVHSPGYPNTSLPKALAHARSIHAADRRNIIDREAAVKHMGYSGQSGAADKALASLAHYGLVEKAGKGQTRVTQLAVDILHPDTQEQRKKALAEAAYTPSIFAEIRERFQDGHPSESALRSWLVRENFLDRAIGPVVSSYMETLRYLEQEGAFESGGPSHIDTAESNHPNTSDRGVQFGGAKVGDLIQWESDGALRFEQPRRVRLVTDDGQWVAVEGSETGMPMNEVIVEAPAPRTVPQAPIIPLASPPPPVAAPEDDSFEEWFRAKVGTGKQIQIKYRGEGDVGANEIQKLIDILTAQKKALED